MMATIPLCVGKIRNIIVIIVIRSQRS